MPRAIWNGAISFGLVNVPVQLFSAVEPKDIHFHQFTRNGQRVRNKRVSEKTGREVDYDDIVKGYELSKDKFVLITPRELDAADPRQTRTIDIEDFVDLGEIDPIYFESSYYLAPRDGASHAYALLRESMQRSERIGIGRFVMRTKQYLAVIRPAGNTLVLHTMFFPDEIRDPKALDIPGRVKISERERRVAEQLIDSLTVAWDPKRYEDTYREEVLSIIKKKAKGQEIVAERAPAPDRKVVDLFEALQASLDATKGRGRKRAKRAPASRRRKAS